MSNPLEVALKGKGASAMIARGWTIARRYGLTSAKMDSGLDMLVKILGEFSCQATLPITAVALSRNPAIIHKLREQELAIHGYTHVDYSQLSLEQQNDHLRHACQDFRRAGVSIAGFRCPYLRWNPDTLSALEDCGFNYDSSQALGLEIDGGMITDGYRHALDFYGAQTVTEYPALPRLVGGLVRIPYCLPDDEALVERLRLPAGPAMSEIWLAMLEHTYAAGELLTLGLHPERVPLLIDALRAVLAKARSFSPPVWIARLDQISAWQRSLHDAAFAIQRRTDGSTCITIHAPSGTTLLTRSVHVEAPKKVWARGYEQVMSNELVLHGEQRPWIGLAPDCTASLFSFLKQQGYLVEVSDNLPAFSYYFHQKTFQHEDERRLLAELETGSRPLIRLCRWPGGAQAALAVTGDVDAFTLWDFGLRAIGR